MVLIAKMFQEIIYVEIDQDHQTYDHHDHHDHCDHSDPPKKKHPIPPGNLI